MHHAVREGVKFLREKTCNTKCLVIAKGGTYHFWGHIITDFKAVKNAKLNQIKSKQIQIQEPSKKLACSLQKH